MTDWSDHLYAHFRHTMCIQSCIPTTEKETMTTYTYTIYDGDPASSGPCAWPSHEDVEIEAESPEDALDEALSEAESHGDTCGEYSTGDTLYVLVWDAAGQQVADGTHTVDTGEPTPALDIDVGGWPTCSGASVTLYLRPSAERGCGRPLVYSFGHVGSGEPEAAWNGRELNLGTVPLDCDPDSLRAWLEAHEETILGLDSEYRGSEVTVHGNRVGRWGVDDEETESVLDVQEAIDRGAIACFWSASDHLGEAPTRDLIDRVNDLGLDGAAEREVEDAAPHVILKEDDVRDYLESVVQNALEAGEYVWLETMPDHLRASHRAARNWGRYPGNGAERRLVPADEANEIIEADPDGYAHVVNHARL